MQDIFTADSETSATQVDGALARMIKHPRILKKAQAEVRELLFGRRGKADETGLPELEYLKLVIRVSKDPPFCSLAAPKGMQRHMRDNWVKDPG
ncbi:hypothetical protein ACJRO7_023906 [Eucalyptus globulus]|uniref:Cytochrome P450 n=1 Tax=Eucalyptus globulus TaxID=34317 RepID=A0ABD3K9E9_EUCGL